ncbi:MAG: tRNA-dihydrouridine synthase, partial [Armatimonadetes bacterium]|nr:tRNA-dihydrouridine synthase [Armatimonadota bacterium]
IVEAIDIPVELGGGLRTVEDVQDVLELGVQWAIMGTAALRDRSELEAAVAQFGDRIIVGIDARDGKVAVEGWTEGSDIDAVEFAQQMQRWGVGRLICTDIATDGMLTGPNLAAMRQFCQAVDIPIIASGGVSSVEDVKALRKLEPQGLIGCIVGRALYTGDLALSEAIEAAQ